MILGLAYLLGIRLIPRIRNWRELDFCRQFTQWVAFGNGGVVTKNERIEQRKRIKYNHLVANCLIFHNVHVMTRALHKMAREGVELSEEALRH